MKTIDVFGLNLQLGIMAVPFTVFWMLGAINSLNLIDGMDGMVGCVGAAISLAIAALSVLSGQFATAIVALTLVGAIFGFLCFNLPPARVYLGDCGSMLIGLILGVMSLQSGLKGPTTVMLTIPLALMTIPIFDTMAAITRRTLTGRSIYTTDRGHLHHCLQRSGLSGQRVLILVSCLCLLTGIGALASMALHRQLFAVVSGLTVAGILLVTRLFGRAELLLLRKQLVAILARLRHGHQEGHTHEVSVHLQGSADWNELWESLTEVAAQLQLSSICLDVNIPAMHERYHAFWDRFGAPPEDGHAWKVEVPLTLRDQIFGRIELKGVRDQTPVFEKIAILGKIAEDIEQAVSLLAEKQCLPVLELAKTQANPSVGLTTVTTT